MISIDGNRHAAGRKLDQMPSALSGFLSSSEKTFPNIIVGRVGPHLHGAVRGRKIAGYPIARLRTSRLTVDASPSKGIDAGFEGWAKLVWQISGRMRFEDADTSFELSPGQAAILPMTQRYRMAMDDDFDGLMVMFQPGNQAEVPGGLCHYMRKPIAKNASVLAARAAVFSMLRHATDESTDGLALDYALDVVFRSIVERDDGLLVKQATGRLRKARSFIERNIDNTAYSPDDLAHDLAVSRRTLFEDFARVGLSPASFMRQVRLDRARREITQSDSNATSLTEIALNNGFADSSSFSRAFKKEFGVPPSSFKRLGGAR